jgi:hypothetical protein
MAIVLLGNLCFWHSEIVFLLKATKALLEKVNSHIKMSFTKTECREVINCFIKYNVIYVGRFHPVIGHKGP